MLPYIIPDMSARQERDYNTLLPDYEEAIAQSLKQPPPPSYQMAMAYSMANQQVTGLQVNLEAMPTTSADDEDVPMHNVNNNNVANVTTNAIVNESIPRAADAVNSTQPTATATATTNPAGQTTATESEYRN